MANEAQVRGSVSIRKGNKVYVSPPNSFNATVSGYGGPSPGVILCSTSGTDVDLSEITTPGLTFIKNQDSTNYVDVGVWNPDQSEFYPLLRLLAGEGYPVRLSPQVNQEVSGTGSGTTGQSNTLRIKANTAACLVLVEVNDE